MDYVNATQWNFIGFSVGIQQPLDNTGFAYGIINLFVYNPTNPVATPAFYQAIEQQDLTSYLAAGSTDFEITVGNDYTNAAGLIGTISSVEYYYYFKTKEDYEKVMTERGTTQYECQRQYNSDQQQTPAYFSGSDSYPGAICASCGDGIVHSSTEECDDGEESNWMNIDFQVCYKCHDGSGVCFEDSHGYSNCLCGNGIIDPISGYTEDCDDGNNLDGDGCSAGCKIETGWDCLYDACTPICGDSMIVGNETCDPGVIGGCTDDCVNINYNYECHGGSSSSASTCYSRHYFRLAKGASGLAFVSTVILSFTSFAFTFAQSASAWTIVTSIQILRTSTLIQDYQNEYMNRFFNDYLSYFDLDYWFTRLASMFIHTTNNQDNRIDTSFMR